ncbi:MAG TPA: hypothetical protein VKB93_16690 [Thermoanaerobaculia bacterium]|nr:hypothetical protein [Thermoanaerobaculia bacterium]
MEWLIEETSGISPLAKDADALSGRRYESSVREAEPASIALRLNDVFVHDTKKWFGAADLRLDAIVVNGASASDTAGFYHPSTFRFADVHDAERLPIEDKGLVFFYGKPKHFLDLSIMLSRDRKDSEDLRELVVKRLGSNEFQTASAALLGLAVAAPQAAAIAAAVGAAATVGNFAAEVLREVTGTTIGLYRASWLEHGDRFGIGRHPERGYYRQKGFEFWYEVLREEE